jgi:C4-dicarboxylate transporter DctM subunit
MSTANGLIIALMTACFLFFGYMGVPVAFALIAGVVIGTMFTPITLAAMIGQLFNGIDTEALMAVPFFLLVGELMTSANVVVRIANLSQALVGHIRGGLAQVVTVFSMFFADMSGSTSADVAVLSRTMAKPMEAEGYGRPFIAALIAAASTIACLVPPSITSVVYGAVGNVSIAGLFLAGFAPAFMIAIGLMTYCYFFGPVGMRRPRSSFGQLTGATKDASLTLVIPVILLGGILSGSFTPTEAGVIANVYILTVVIPALNRGHLKHLWRDVVHAGLIYSLPLITIAAASAFGWMLAYLRGPMVISGWISDFAGNDPVLIMFALVLVFTVVGDFIEPIPCIVIFMPIVAALCEAADINTVHMGVVLIVTLAFGLITPPYGLALLMASKFVDVRFPQALRAALPIYVIFFATIAASIFFPKVVLFLPQHILPESVGCFKNPSGPGYICPQ